jgi:hypothetical protein
MEYSQTEIEKIQKEDAFWPRAQRIHEERAKADLMYGLLFYPNMPVANNVLLIDRLLEAFFTVIERVNAPLLAKVKRIQQARTFLLQSGKADLQVKTFNVLVMLSREPELHQVMRTGFDTTSSYSLFAEDSLTHFDDFLRELHRMVEMTFNWPYNEYNVVPMIRDFCKAAQKAYLEQ